MPREDIEMTIEERDLLLQIAARMAELMDLAQRIGAEVLAERLAVVEACALKHLSAEDGGTPVQW